MKLLNPGVFGRISSRWYAASRNLKEGMSCPACDSQEIQIKDDLFCCKTCPNRQGIDYFKLLGLPRLYSIDLKAAEESYKSLQKQAHPDVVRDAGSASIPEGYSSLLNKAIHVIKSPTERALHLLYILDKCSISESDLTNDSGLLMEMMDLNEEVEDCGKDEKCLIDLERANNSRIQSCESDIGKSFQNKDYKHARKICERMHYLERVKSTISKKLLK